MPLPKTRDVGKIISKLDEEGGRSRKQKIAIALDVARRSGAKIPRKDNPGHSKKDVLRALNNKIKK